MKRVFPALLFLFLVVQSEALSQDEPPRIELFGGYAAMRNDASLPLAATPYYGTSQTRIANIFSGGNLTNAHGWNASVTYYLTRRLGLVADFEGQYSPLFEYRTFSLPDLDWQSAYRSSSHSFLFGPRFAFRPDSRVRPFVQGLVGLSSLNRRASGHGKTSIYYYEFDPEVGFESKNEIVDLEFLENRVTGNIPTVGVGGGVDLRVNRHLAIRLFQCDFLAKRGRGQERVTYMLTGANEAPVLSRRTDLFDQRNVRISYGLVVTF